MRHLYISMGKQVCLCELCMLPALHQQPRKHRWRSRADCSSQGDTNTRSVEHVSVLSPDCNLCQSMLPGHRRHFLMTVHPDIFYIRIYFFSDLLSAVVLHQDLSEICGEMICGDGALTKIGRYCPELLHREASLHKSELNHFPDCMTDIQEFLGV